MWGKKAKQMVKGLKAVNSQTWKTESDSLTRIKSRMSRRECSVSICWGGNWRPSVYYAPHSRFSWGDLRIHLHGHHSRPLAPHLFLLAWSEAAPLWFPCLSSWGEIKKRDGNWMTGGLHWSSSSGLPLPLTVSLFSIHSWCPSVFAITLASLSQLPGGGTHHYLWRIWVLVFNSWWINDFLRIINYLKLTQEIEN